MIWTTPALKVKAGTIFTRDYWISQAKGIEDQYGNPFRVVTLRWNWSNLNKTTEFQKTNGFEDAILGATRSGEISVTYRMPGSIMWQRPFGGIGAFVALCPVTPRNMKKLASCFPNRRWFIVDDDIRQLVEKMWNDKYELMSDELKRINNEWFKLMHTAEGQMPSATGVEAQEIAADKKTIADKNLELARKEQDLAAKEANLNMREQNIVDFKKIQIGDGVEVFQISERSLRKMKLHELKKEYRRRQLPDVDNKTSKDIPDMISAILEQQGGDPEVEKARTVSALEE